MLFTQCEDLSKVKTSLEIPSEVLIAQLEFGDGLKVVIDVFGEVKVRFFEKDDEGNMDWNTYYDVSDFPDELIALIREGEDSDRYEFDDTNWFSIVFYGKDGCVFDDEALDDEIVTGKSPEQIYELLVKNANWFEENLGINPTNFKEFSDLKPNEIDIKFK